MVCHCLLIETPKNGLVLVDTGLGTQDLASPREQLGAAFLASSAPALRPLETALHQVKSLGYQASDVQHILLTHLDLDHAGGLRDFPAATVHLLHDEKVAAETPNTFLAKSRYRPVQWTHVKKWETYDSSKGEDWRGFKNAQRIRGISEHIHIIPLIGHTLGHAGYAVERKEGALLHCGDAYFHGASIRGKRLGSKTPWGLTLFQQLVAADRKRMNQTQAELEAIETRSLKASQSLTLFCAHDPDEQKRLMQHLETPLKL
jgi:glyoxylase-like metal-dependent hydrolase (beta-lactamase superfamily II)